MNTSDEVNELQDMIKDFVVKSFMKNFYYEMYYYDRLRVWKNQVYEEGKIQIIEVNAGGVGRDAQELLRKVKAAQYVHAHPGEVCPAKWKEGDATLAPSIDLIGKI